VDALQLFRSDNSLTPINVPLRQKEIAMLVLTRKLDESIRISDNIKITVLRIKGNTVRIGIEAPRDVRVIRTELASAEPASEAAVNQVVSGSHNASDNNASDSTVTAIVDSPTIAGPRLFVGTITADGRVVELNEEVSDRPMIGGFELDPVLTKDQAAPLRAFLRSGRGLTAV